MRIRYLPVLVAAAVSLPGMAQPAPTQRQQEVAAKGAQVMPFDVHAATHVFLKTSQGGIQQVLSKDPKDTASISMIRMHLKEEAARFARGDYSDPMRIHGAGMPGVQYLSHLKPGQMRVSYRETPAGAEIDYTAKDAAGVEAIHRWFDAQLADHGADATDKPAKQGEG